jgi:CHAD domain-containing protein
MKQLQPAFEDLRIRLMEAIAACRDRSQPKAVHNLRTLTRRLEALLTAAAEEHRGAVRLHNAIDKVRDNLKQIRRAAGAVRDLDVLDKLTQSIADESMQQDAESLCHHLSQDREPAAKELQHLLTFVELDIERNLQRTAKRLAALSEKSTEAATIATRWTKSARPRNGNGQLTSRQLHNFRKRTKTARYLAELQPESEAAANLAESLHELQDKIGYWHDCELLAQQANQILGKKSALSKAVDEQRKTAFRQAMSMLSAREAKKKSSPAHTRQSPAEV